MATQILHPDQVLGAHDANQSGAGGFAFVQIGDRRGDNETSVKDPETQSFKRGESAMCATASSRWGRSSRRRSTFSRATEHSLTTWRLIISC